MTVDQVIEKAEFFRAEGADVIDVGFQITFSSS